MVCVAFKCLIVNVEKIVLHFWVEADLAYAFRAFLKGAKSGDWGGNCDFGSFAP
jgi:hypothetical protein